MACPRCGSDVPAAARFCPSCGTELAVGSRQEERKLVSILFVDQVGSTARADGADPEDVRDRNQRYFDAVREPILRYGGVVEKYIGDAVMAVFGAPLARLDDAERAVRAALDVLGSLTELNARDPGLDLAARAAVCTGEAVVATDAAPEDALATGDVVNTAARLQSAAPPGRLIVDLETHRLTRHSFVFETIPAIDAKGKREPIPALLVEASVDAPAGRPLSHTALVGRERELRLLRTLWENAVGAARPQLISILGPAGIGKTRLAREVADDVERSGGRALWGRSLPYEEQTPYRALGQMIRHVSSIYENDPVDDARRKLGIAVGDLFPFEEVADATRFLSLLLGLGQDEPADEPIHLYYAARRFLELLAERGPLLVVFEDLHWADDALLEAIGYLLSHVRDTPIVFLALARPEFLDARPTWGAGATGGATLPLEPLSPEDASGIVASMISTASEADVERIVRAAGGNPLFLEELVAARSDDPSPEELPTTVRAAISARIDALHEPDRSVLLHASVIGQTFWRGILTTASGLDDVDPALEALEARGLVIRRPQSQVLGDVEFGFKHMLIRDVAYATLPRATRRSMHAATAGTIERSGADPAGLGWVLAHHWREAGEVDVARRYLLAAADRARDASAVEETYDLLTRALDLATTDEDRLAIRLRRGVDLVELGEYDRAIPELEEIMDALDDDAEIQALLALAEATLWTERTEQTIELAQRAIDLTDATEEDLRPLAVARLSHGLASRGDEGDIPRAIELGDRALRDWRPGVSQRTLSEHYHLHSDTTYWAGQYERALDLARSAASTGGVEPNSAEFVLRGSGMEGLILAGIGRYEEAIAAGERAIATARRMGRGDNVVLNYSTLPLREIFDLGEARERSTTVVDRLGPSQFNMPWMNARADLLGVQLLQGDIANVEADWPGAWDDAVASAAWERWLISGRLAAYRAELALALGRPDDAETWAHRAIELARVGHRPKYQAIGHTWLGDALAMRGEPAAAVQELRAAIALADTVGSPLLRWQTRAALVGPARAANTDDPEGALRDAQRIIRAVADSLSPERASVYVAAPLVEGVLAAG